MKQFEAIKQLISEMESDVQKFYNGTNAAGTRVRKSLQSLKQLCNEMRQDIQSVRESRKGE